MNLDKENQESETPSKNDFPGAPVKIYAQNKKCQDTTQDAGTALKQGAKPGVSARQSAAMDEASFNKKGRTDNDIEASVSSNTASADQNTNPKQFMNSDTPDSSDETKH